MKTTALLAILFAAVLGGGALFGQSISIGISFNTLLTFHITAICITGALVLYADEQALMWLLGKKERLNPREVLFMHYAVAIGLATIITTGSLMFLPAASYYLAQPAFIVKMVAVASLIINTYFIDRFSLRATTHTFAELVPAQRDPLIWSGAVSVLGWATAIICGLLLH